MLQLERYVLLIHQSEAVAPAEVREALAADELPGTDLLFERLLLRQLGVQPDALLSTKVSSTSVPQPVGAEITSSPSRSTVNPTVRRWSLQRTSNWRSSTMSVEITG